MSRRFTKEHLKTAVGKAVTVKLTFAQHTQSHQHDRQHHCTRTTQVTFPAEVQTEIERKLFL